MELLQFCASHQESTVCRNMHPFNHLSSLLYSSLRSKLQANYDSIEKSYFWSLSTCLLMLLINIAVNSFNNRKIQCKNLKRIKFQNKLSVCIGQVRSSLKVISTFLRTIVQTMPPQLLVLKSRFKVPQNNLDLTYPSLRKGCCPVQNQVTNLTKTVTISLDHRMLDRNYDELSYINALKILGKNKSTTEVYNVILST